MLYISLYLTGKWNQFIWYEKVIQPINRSIRVTARSPMKRRNTVQRDLTADIWRQTFLLSFHILPILCLCFIPYYVATVLSLSMLHDNVASTSDISASIIFASFATWRVYCYFWMNPFGKEEWLEKSKVSSPRKETMWRYGGLKCAGMPRCVLEDSVSKNSAKERLSG